MSITSRAFFRTGLAIFFVIGLIVSGCTKNDADADSEEPAEKSAPSRVADRASPDRGRGDLPELTTQEAAAMAYTEAKKWRSDAVVWYMMPLHPDLRAADNGLAWDWTVIFADPGDEKTFNVRIKYGAVTDAAEQKYVNRVVDIPDGLPAKAPKATLRDAARAVHDAGVPPWETPMCIYTVENSYKRFRGRPMWECVAQSIQTLFSVDGLTGKVASIRDYKGNEIEPSAAKQRPVAENGNRFQMADFIYGFFEAMGRGDYNAGLAMMDPQCKGNQRTQDMWKQGFGGLSAVRAVSVLMKDPKDWSEGRPLFQAEIYCVPKSGDMSGGWEHGVNTRFISLVPAGQGWKIAEIATGR